MFGTLLWPFILYLVASSSIVDYIFFWLYRLMPGGRKFATLKASSPSSIRSLQNAVRGYRFVKIMLVFVLQVSLFKWKIRLSPWCILGILPAKIYQRCLFTAHEKAVAFYGSHCFFLIYVFDFRFYFISYL